MARSKVPTEDQSAQTIAAWSAVGGLVAALITTTVSGRLLPDQRAGDAATFGALGFVVTFLAPFVVSLAAFLVPSRELRRAVWLASGVLAMIIGGLTLLNGIGWLFGAVGAGFIVAWWVANGDAGLRGTAWANVLTGWLVLCLGAALGMLWLHNTPMCWNDSATDSGWVSARTSGDCVSDIIDDTEGLLAITCVGLGLAAMALIARGDRPGGNRDRNRRVSDRASAARASMAP